MKIKNKRKRNPEEIYKRYVNLVGESDFFMVHIKYMTIFPIKIFI